MKRLLLASLLLAAPATAAEEMPRFTDFEAAATEARESGRDILIEFTGTGWCSFCKDMRERLFQLEAFREWMTADYVWLEVNHVINKWDLEALPPEAVEHRAELRRRYPAKVYPTLFLCDGEGRPYALREGFVPDASTEEHFFKLAQLREKRALRDAALARAEEASGEARLEAIEEALNVVPQACVARFYAPLLEELEKGRPQSPLVEAIAHKRNLAEQERGLFTGLKRRDFDSVLAGVDAILDEGGLQGEELQRFLLVRLRALVGLDKEEEAAALATEISAVNPRSVHAIRANRIIRSMRKPSEFGEIPDPRSEPGSVTIPRDNATALEKLLAPLEIESEDLSGQPLTVLQAHRTRAEGALQRVRYQIEKEHQQWEDYYFRRKALIEQNGPDHEGVGEFDRIIDSLKQQHEKTHQRESELAAFCERLATMAEEQYSIEQAALEVDDLMEEATELEEEARKRLEDKP